MAFRRGRICTDTPGLICIGKLALKGQLLLIASIIAEDPRDRDRREREQRRRQRAAGEIPDDGERRDKDATKELEVG